MLHIEFPRFDGGVADASGGHGAAMTVAAGVIALVALAGVVASLAYLHLAPTGLSPLHNAVSQYGITPYRAGYRSATLTFAVAGIALAAGLAGALSGAKLAQVVALLIVFAIARALISWFPMDAPGAQRTRTGVTHGLLAIAAFGAATLAAERLASVLSSGTKWHSLEPASKWLGWAMLAFLIGMALARRSPQVRSWFGAIERGFYLSAIAWFAVFATACVVGVG